MNNKLIEQAYRIAKESLRACYDEFGILAGRHHYSDYWARDGFFASLGALELGDHDIVNSQLRMYLFFQLSDGQLPLRVGNKFAWLRYLGFKLKKKVDPVYHKFFPYNPPTDSNTLLLTATEAYIKKTKDVGFAKEHIEKLTKTFTWNQTLCDGHLIWEQRYQNWVDSVKKRGFCLYSNVLFYKAAKSLAYIYKQIDDQFHAKDTEKFARRIKEEIQSNFWSGGYFVDWIDNNRVYDYFDVGGNVLACLWGVATPEQTKKIISLIQQYHLDHPVPCRTNYPDYPRKLINPWFDIIGLQDYHNNSMGWLWIGCFAAIAFCQIDKKYSEELLTKIAEIIVRDQIVYEVYERDGTPVKRFAYTSEHPFAWNAGAFIAAVKTVCE